VVPILLSSSHFKKHESKREAHPQVFQGLLLRRKTFPIVKLQALDFLARPVEIRKPTDNNSIGSYLDSVSISSLTGREKRG